jgi:SAM-dependent methyltransferase
MGRIMQSLRLDQLVTLENFDEAGYLAANPDVASAVAAGRFDSGLQHFTHFGVHERRRFRATGALVALRRAKMARVLPFLRSDLPYTHHDGKFNFLTEELRRQTAISDTENVGANAYPVAAEDMIKRYPNGLLLDCGAGKRDVYHTNVVNLEIVDYDSTDVIGVGEQLPFKDGTFDGVISIAVLEHVRDPFACAAEMVRVLKPGGEIACEVPFLQPLHGFPHHYYNMTPQGLRALFERSIAIDDVCVLPSARPIWWLVWAVQRWAEALDPASRQAFLSVTIADLLRPATDFLERPWVTGLPAESNFELAAATFLKGHKPAG